MSHWSPLCAAVECQVDWASPDKHDDECIGGEEPQALAAEPQAEAKLQEALEDMVLLPLGEADPPMGGHIPMRRRA